MNVTPVCFFYTGTENLESRKGQVDRLTNKFFMNSFLNTGGLSLSAVEELIKMFHFHSRSVLSSKELLISYLGGLAFFGGGGEE